MKKALLGLSLTTSILFACASIIQFKAANDYSSLAKSDNKIADLYVKSRNIPLALTYQDLSEANANMEFGSFCLLTLTGLGSLVSIGLGLTNSKIRRCKSPIAQPSTPKHFP